MCFHRTFIHASIHSDTSATNGMARYNQKNILQNKRVNVHGKNVCNNCYRWRTAEQEETPSIHIVIIFIHNSRTYAAIHLAYKYAIYICRMIKYTISLHGLRAVFLFEIMPTTYDMEKTKTLQLFNWNVFECTMFCSYAYIGNMYRISLDFFPFTKQFCINRWRRIFLYETIYWISILPIELIKTIYQQYLCLHWIQIFTVHLNFLPLFALLFLEKRSI